MIRLVLSLIFIICFCFKLNAFETEQDAVNYIMHLKVQVEDAVNESNGDEEYAYSKLINVIKDSLDFDEICKFVLGRYWIQASNDQKEKFVEEYRSYINRLYAKYLYKYSMQRLNIFGATQILNGGYIVNATLIQDNNR